MRIVVAMATYQGDRFLEEQLASITAQTRPPDAVYVRDDASTDGTVEVLKAFAASAPFPVHVTVSELRHGVTGNFERVVEEIEQADLIVLSDQDDVWLPQKLERLERAFVAAPGATLAFSDAHLIDSSGARLGLRRWHIPGFDARQQRAMARDPFGQLTSHYIVSGCMLAFRSEQRDLVLPFPSELQFDDSDMHVLHDKWISMVSAATGDVLVLDEPLFEYRIHPDQTIGIARNTRQRLLLPQAVRWQLVAYRSRRRPEYLAGMARLLSVLRDRVAATVPGPEGDASLASIDEARAHLEVRIATGPAGRSRGAHLRAVVADLRAGRYRRYSYGIASAVIDVVRYRTSA